MKHFIVEMTCFACPEQYDVYLDNKQVGYLRLRYGHFRCDYLECSRKRLFDTYTEGDGIFEEEERDPMIREALSAIMNELKLTEDFDYRIVQFRYV